MIASCVLPNSARNVFYVDYDAASSHAIMLYLAKPFHDDVGFDNLYMDILPDVPRTGCELDGENIDVQFTLYADGISRAIFDVKRRYVIQPPLILFGVLEEIWSLRYRGTSMRNYSKNPDVFFRSVATDIFLSQAVNIEGLFACLRMLSIKR